MMSLPTRNLQGSCCVFGVSIVLMREASVKFFSFKSPIFKGGGPVCAEQGAERDVFLCA
jgi:hypothetical protein